MSYRLSPNNPAVAFGLVEDSFVPLSQVFSLHIIYLAGISVGRK